MKALLRVAGRCIVVVVIFSCAMLVAVQYWRLAEQKVALSAQYSEAQHDVQALRALREHQLSEIRRLSDPLGAIPEIQALIYVQAAPAQAP
jgi:predicted negative regulator of RcsB-dependent stress response